ncbi:uncharacterized protein SOCE26_012190 [Sorangium cellulosum]|uniref:Uncharacterized protein n=1 Tax=Sorangium cellulosum TaxID=56 RepID=A0A2L0EKK7_SORCE|nr:uncharacterized protein SOCE26_012190 [Sorangium cellulosum]
MDAETQTGTGTHTSTSTSTSTSTTTTTTTTTEDEDEGRKTKDGERKTKDERRMVLRVCAGPCAGHDSPGRYAEAIFLSLSGTSSARNASESAVPSANSPAYPSRCASAPETHVAGDFPSTSTLASTV